MSKIGVNELAAVLASKHGLEQSVAEIFVRQMFDVINEGLKNEKLVKIKGLGTFKIMSVSARKSVDVNTGDPIIIEGRDKISFTADSVMKDIVNAPFAQFETVVVNDGVDFSGIDEKYKDEMSDSDEENEEVGTSMKQDNVVQDDAGISKEEEKNVCEETEENIEPSEIVEVNETANDVVENDETVETVDNPHDEVIKTIEEADDVEDELLLPKWQADRIIS